MHAQDARIPVPLGHPQSILVLLGHPQNILESKSSQTRMIAWFPENILDILEILAHFRISGSWLAHAYIYK